MKKETYAFIFARKSSKRLKNKNIKKLNGLELINYSIFLVNLFELKKIIYHEYLSSRVRWNTIF